MNQWHLASVVFALHAAACGGTSGTTAVAQQNGTGEGAGNGGSGQAQGGPPASSALPVDPSAPPSCRYRQAGAGLDCSADKNVDCCASTLIPGGTAHTDAIATDVKATVSPFRLDLFEITRGRFRAFFDAWPESKPKAGDGAHPKHPGSGWDPVWDDYLPPTKEGLLQSLTCETPSQYDALRWADAPDERDWLPVSCVSWFHLLAFCAWDGGRLPTGAEWLIAAVGGDEDRLFPWGSEPPSPTLAILGYTTEDLAQGPFLPVGSKPMGRARWGHFDMVGSRSEYLLDRSTVTAKYPGTALDQESCFDCVNISPPGERSVRITVLSIDIPAVATTNDMTHVGSFVVRGKSQRLAYQTLLWQSARCARDL